MDDEYLRCWDFLPLRILSGSLPQFPLFLFICFCLFLIFPLNFCFYLFPYLFYFPTSSLNTVLILPNTGTPFGIGYYLFSQWWYCSWAQPLFQYQYCSKVAPNLQILLPLPSTTAPLGCSVERYLKCSQLLPYFHLLQYWRLCSPLCSLYFNLVTRLQLLPHLCQAYPKKKRPHLFHKDYPFMTGKKILMISRECHFEASQAALA